MGHVSRLERGTIVPFVRRRPSPPRGITVRDRIAALRWADAARSSGVRAVQVHDPEPGDDPALGGFLLVYREGGLWASWGVSIADGRYEVWRPASSTTIGCYETLDEALATIQALN